MNTLRAISHLARADFLERVRHYSFLVILSLALWVGYLSANGQIRMRVPPDYTGVINSAWAGATMTLIVSFFLGWVGFYLVKGSVNRDYATGVGQIMAATPLSRPAYTVGKWLSNFAVLAIMVVLLFLAGVVMMLWFGEGPLDLWALAAPLLFLALPAMALVAAVAVLFETISFLRGGLGNIVYFGLFLAVLTLSMIGSSFADGAYRPYADYAGMQVIASSVMRAALAEYPQANVGFAFSIEPFAQSQMFTWHGLQWTSEIILWRLVFFLLAFGIALLAALPFDRFNPSRMVMRRPRNPIGLYGLDSRAPQDVTACDHPDGTHLSRLDRAKRRFRFAALFVAELKLLVKGWPWWWHAVAGGLIVAALFAPPDAVRILLILVWTWPVLILSGLGCREARFNTQQVIFSAPRPLLSQLPAAWLAAALLVAALGLGALLRFVSGGEWLSVAGWFVGVLFIPSLALALGVVTGASKPFEVLFIFWMYGLTQKAPPLDFAGLWPGSPFWVFALLAPVLLGVAALARRQQLVTGRV